MKKKKFTCDNCGANDFKIENDYAVCQYCGTRFLISDNVQAATENNDVFLSPQDRRAFQSSVRYSIKSLEEREAKRDAAIKDRRTEKRLRSIENLLTNIHVAFYIIRFPIVGILFIACCINTKLLTSIPLLLYIILSCAIIMVTWGTSGFAGGFDPMMLFTEPLYSYLCSLIAGMYYSGNIDYIKNFACLYLGITFISFIASNCLYKAWKTRLGSCCKRN